MTVIANFPIQADIFSSNDGAWADETLAKKHPEKNEL
jgi:hypothetical protein